MRAPLANALKKNCTRDPLLPSPDDSVEDAIDVFRNHRTHCLLIMDDGKLAGILSGRDILLKVAQKPIDRERTPVARIMTPAPSVLSDDNTVGHAFNKLSIGRFRHLPIQSCEDGSMGLISVIGLLTYIYDVARQTSDDADAT
jgi:CBS domain-containing protein